MQFSAALGRDIGAPFHVQCVSMYSGQLDDGEEADPHIGSELDKRKNTEETFIGKL